MAIISTLDPTLDAETRIFAAKPNWSEKFRVSYEFLTDIITSENGKEQRRACRVNPRKSIEFQAVFNGKSKVSFDAFMASWHPRRTILPEYPYYVTTTSPLYGQAQQVPYENEDATAPFWLIPGTMVVLITDTFMETRTVSAVGVNTVQFSEKNDTVFPRGTRIVRAVAGRLETEPEATYSTNDVLVMPVRLDVEPGSETYPNTAEGETVGFREVMMRKANWASPTRQRFIYPRNIIDYGYGKVGNIIPYNFPARITTADYVGRSREDVQQTIDFFVRKRGRAREFLMPTWENDIPYFAITGGGFAIVINSADFGIAYADSTVYRRIVLRLADGTYSHHLVDYIETLPDTNSSVLWTVDQLPISDLSPTTLIGISWVPAVRFATDRLDVDWLTDDVAQYSLTFQSLENFEL